MNISAVLFDLDGLLTDTESIHMVSYQQVLKKYSITLSDREYIDHWITSGFGICEFVENHSLPFDYRQLRNEKAVIFHALLRKELKLMPYAKDILENLFGKKRMALASSSSRDNVDAVLRHLALEKYFEVIISGSEVQTSKPSPDIFIRAADLLGVKNTECIVLEDALKGVIAANRAQMTVIAIPNVYTIGSDFSTADYVQDSLQGAEKIILGN